MKRRLFTICSAASLLLCAATCVQWVRSRFALDWWQVVGFDIYTVGFTLPGALQLRICTNHGTINYWNDVPHAPRLHADHIVISSPSYWAAAPFPAARINFRLGSFMLVVTDDSRGMDGRVIRATFIGFPFWSAVLATMICPGL